MHFHAKNLNPQKCVIFNIVYARYKSINALDKSTCDAKKKLIDSISICYDVWGKHKSSLVVQIVQINHQFSWNTNFMNVQCVWNSVLVVAFIVQLFAFSGIKAANWNKKRTKRCILPISMLPDLNAEHLYFAPSPLSLFKMGGFYGNIIEPSD